MTNEIDLGRGGLYGLGSDDVPPYVIDKNATTKPALPLTPTKWVRRGSRTEEYGEPPRGLWHLSIVGAHGIPFKRALCGVEAAFHGNLGRKWWEVKGKDGTPPDKQCRKCIALNQVTLP